MGMTSGLIQLSVAELGLLLAGTKPLDDYLFGDAAEDPDVVCDLDKAWNGVMFLLEAINESEASLEKAVLGGTPFGEDMGYGPPMSLQPDEVAEIAARLKNIDADRLKSAFDVNAMEAAGVYSFNASNADEDLKYILAHYTQMRMFYQSAAENENAIIQYLI